MLSRFANTWAAIPTSRAFAPSSTRTATRVSAGVLTNASLTDRHSHDEPEGSVERRASAQLSVACIPRAGREVGAEPAHEALFDPVGDEAPCRVRAPGPRVQERLGPAVVGLAEAIGARQRDRQRRDVYRSAEREADAGDRGVPARLGRDDLRCVLGQP